jgi:hypothetical protein
MRTYLQLPVDTADLERTRTLRGHFRDYVQTHADRHHDRVLILEPDAVLVEEWRDLWAGWHPYEVKRGWIGNGSSSSAILWRPEGVLEGYAPLLADRSASERRYPSHPLAEVEVPVASLTQLVAAEPEAVGGYILAIDASLRGVDLTTLIFPKEVDEVLLTWTDDQHTQAIAKDLGALFQRRGLRAAGRPWGEAGSSLRLTRSRGVVESASAVAAQVKAQSGQAWVWVRDSLLGPSRREEALQPVKVALNPSINRQDVLDPTPGRAIAQPALRDVEERLPATQRPLDASQSVSVSVLDDPREHVAECWERHGVWPISFSYPRPFLPVNPEPRKVVAPITPGIPYSFTDEEAYRATYADAIWGVTHRKAGWDCFRHVEILGAGSTPLMLDAARIPRFSMVHYPKSTFARLAALQKQNRDAVPDLATKQALHDYAGTYLTSKAMAHYLLHAAGVGDANSVLFVDQVLPHQVDYQSVLTLIGLKQLMGRRCHVLHPVDYIYTDTKVATTDLFGRGFGFTRTLDREDESDTERGRIRPLADYDALVVGSIARNEKLATSLLADFPAERTIWIHGEDLPPRVEEVATYRRRGVHAFVRAIHTTR